MHFLLFFIISLCSIASARTVEWKPRAITTSTISSPVPAFTIPVSGPLPDFTPDEGWLRDTMYIDHVNASDDKCLIEEGCVSGLGMRTVIRFDTLIHNIGIGDAYIGAPPSSPLDPRAASQPWFVWSPCHRHWHYTSYADYRIKDLNGTIVARGHKNGFCLMDSLCPLDDYGKPVGMGYNCSFQGISGNCSDIYTSNLACQFIDVTGVPLIATQVYLLQVEINPNRTFPESNYTNNVASTPFRLADLYEEFSGLLERPPDAAPPGTFTTQSNKNGRPRKMIEVPGKFLLRTHDPHD